MTQNNRQNNLLAAEDYQVIYDSFRQANFRSYDFETIRETMQNYIQNNFPENFNDWIQSSEFVAIIELLAMIGNNLAFRIDLGMRETFLSTAEKRESVIKIAEFLGYSPRRNVAASGFLKIKSIKTDEDVFGSDGQSLKNIEITNFANDSNYQNFLLVLNKILSPTNSFGNPIAKNIVNNVANELYSINRTPEESVVFPFVAKINSTDSPFAIHNIEFNNNHNVAEREPNISDSFNILYRNNNEGIESPQNGFFVGFKQGTLNYIDYNVEDAVKNLILTVDVANINNDDIWVQTVDKNGDKITNWIKVENTFGNNVIYNFINNKDRNLFSVKTLDNDSVALHFGDGVFANIPRGIIRIWYRVSANQSYVLSRNDIRDISFTMGYTSNNNNIYTATFVVSLEENVINAQARESVFSIKENAGRVFAAQDRMITAADYNILPFAESSNIRKLKAINRTYAGHSRFISLNDPTGNYQNVSIVANDGYIYGKNRLFRQSITIPTMLLENQIFDNYIKPQISSAETVNLFYSINNIYPLDSAVNYHWKRISYNSASSSGFIENNTDKFVQRVGLSASTELSRINNNSLIEFIEYPYLDGSIGKIGDVISVDSPGEGYLSPPNVLIFGSGTGALATARINSDGQVVEIVIVNGGTGYTGFANIAFVGGEGEGAFATVRIQTSVKVWARVTDIFQDGLGDVNVLGNPSGITHNQGSIVLNKNIPDNARVNRIFPAYKNFFTAEERRNILNKITERTSFGISFSVTSQKWNIIDDIETLTDDNVEPGNLVANDKNNNWLMKIYFTGDVGWEILTRQYRIIFGSENEIAFFNQTSQLKINQDTFKPERDTITLLPTEFDFSFFVLGQFVSPSGFSNDRQVLISLGDVENNLVPHNPTVFSALFDNQVPLWNRNSPSFKQYLVYDNELALENEIEPLAQYDGSTNLLFQWKRIADNNIRIDPSISNIIDVSIITTEYYDKYQQWLNSTDPLLEEPLPETIDYLNVQFDFLKQKKAISDTIFFKSGKFKVIFGNKADESLRARFRVVRVANTPLTNNEIKSRIVTEIKKFFDIDNWEFGEIFYFTEMAAYIHKQLAGVISSIAIVPTQDLSVFGDLFQVTPANNELFAPDVRLVDVDIVDELSDLNLRTQLRV